MTYEKIYTNETLDFANFNEPFKRASLEVEKVLSDAKDLEKESSDYDIFTNKDQVTVKSNGVANLFLVDETDKKIIIENDLVLKVDTFLKKSQIGGSYSNSGPLNIEEILLALKDADFLRRDMMFDDKLQISDFRGTNLVSLQDVKDSAFERGSVVSVKSLSNTKTISTVESPVVRSEAMEEFFHKDTSGKTVNVSDTNINSLEIKNITASTIEFGDNVVFSDDKNISNREASRILYSNSSVVSDRITIENPQDNAPINKRVAEKITSVFVNKIDKMFEYLNIKREYGQNVSIEDNAILTKNEAESIIDSFFDSLVSPTIRTLNEYESLVSSVCSTEEDKFISREFEIDGGKVYLGFDYDNMNSVLNSEATMKILSDDGAIGATGKTLKAMSYIGNIETSQDFFEIASALGYTIDLKNVNASQLISFMKNVINDICNMDILPLLGTAEIPKVDVGETQSIFSDPQLDFISADYISPIVVMPNFISIPETLIVTNVSRLFNVSYSSNNIIVPVLVEPLYIQTINSLSVTKPSEMSYATVSNDRRSLYIDVGKPSSPKALNLSLYSRNVAQRKTFVFYDNAECDKRVKAVSYRTINDFDFQVLLRAILDTEADKKKLYLISDGNNSQLLKPATAVVKFASDIMCEVNATLEIEGVSVVIDANKALKIIVDNTQGSGTNGESRFGCLGLPTGNPHQDTRLAIVSDGNAIIDNSGDRDSVSEYLKSELFVPTITMYSKFDKIDSDSYMQAVVASATVIKDAVELYFRTRSIDKLDTGDKPNSLTLRSRDYIKESGSSDDAMEEYLSFFDIDAGYTDSKIGTSDGMFTSRVQADISIADYRTKYGYAVKNFTSGANRAFCEGSDITMPSLSSGSIEYRFFYPDTQSDAYISTLSYGSYDTMSECVAMREPTVAILKDGNNVFIYTHGCIGTIQTRNESHKVSDDPELYENGVASYLVTSSSTGERKIVYLGFNLDSTSCTVLGVVDCNDTRTPILRVTTSNNSITGLSGGGMVGSVSIDSNNLGGYGSLSTRTMRVSVNGHLRPDNGDTSNQDPESCTANSTIEGNVFENISSLRHIDPDVPSSWTSDNGTIPGNLSLNIHARVSGYTLGTANGSTVATLRDDNIIVPISMGTIDGIKDSAGDILAQGKSPEEVEESTGDHKVYICGAVNCKYIEDLAEHSKYEIDFDEVLASITTETTFEGYTVEDLPLNKTMVISDDANGYDILDNSVQVVADKNTGFGSGTVVVGELGVSSVQFSIKHEGVNPNRPIATSAAGFEATILEDGKKLVSTLDTSTPTIMSDGQMLPNVNDYVAMKPSGSKLIIFIRKALPPYGGTGKIVLKDTLEEGAGSGGSGDGGDSGDYTDTPLYELTTESDSLEEVVFA